MKYLLTAARFGGSFAFYGQALSGMYWASMFSCLEPRTTASTRSQPGGMGVAFMASRSSLEKAEKGEDFRPTALVSISQPRPVSGQIAT